MPPLYCWEDKKTDRKLEVMRAFAEYEEIPTREECSGWTDEEYQAAVWERLIYGTQRMVRGPNWGYGSKGNW